MIKEQELLLRFRLLFLVTTLFFLWKGTDKLFIISIILLAIYIEIINLNWRLKNEQ